MTDALAGKEEDDRVWTAPSEEDPTYRLLVDCNQLAVDIDNEIGIIHNFMRDKYRLKFPELESLVHHPIDYARVVQAIGTSRWWLTLNTARALSAHRLGTVCCCYHNIVFVHGLFLRLLSICLCTIYC